MDTSQIPQEILTLEDIRHSDEWLEYLKVFGWRKYTTANGIKLAYMNQPIGRVAKVQRPINIQQADVEELHMFAKKNRLAFIKVEPSITQDLPILDNNKFRMSHGFMSPPSTLFIDLRRKENDMWNSFSHSAKYSVNRAVREGARVERITNPSPEVLRTFYDLVESTTETKKFTTISYEHLVRKNEIFGDKTLLFLVYDKSGRLDGGKYFLGYGKNVWYMYGGTSLEGRKNKSGYTLVWEAFLGLKRAGYEWLDFEGVDDPRLKYTQAWGGFAHFKEKFGGVRVEFPYPRIRYYSKLIDVLSRVSNFEV